VSRIPEPLRSNLITGLSYAHGAAALEIEGVIVELTVHYQSPLTYVIRPFIRPDVVAQPCPPQPPLREPFFRFQRRLLQPRDGMLKLWDCPTALVEHFEKEFNSIRVLGDRYAQD
jgi:hypothetical protein